MEVGKPQRVVRVEPVRDPVPRREPQKEPPAPPRERPATPAERPA